MEKKRIPPSPPLHADHRTRSNEFFSSIHNVLLSRLWKCLRPLTDFPHISTSVCVPDRADSIPVINSSQRSVGLRRAENSFERRRVAPYVNNGLCCVSRTRGVCVFCISCVASIVSYIPHTCHMRQTLDSRERRICDSIS